MSRQHLLKAKALEAYLLQIIEQPHTSRRLCVAIFPAAHEIETPPAFLFVDELDPELLQNIREVVINALQHQITRHFTRHHSLMQELADRDKNLQREQAQEQKKQLDLFQLRQQAREQFNQATGGTRFDDEGDEIPQIAPF